MLGIISILGLGFLLGIRHAFEADHVAAVSTIVCYHKSVKKSSLLGMLWGLGHTLSLLVVGIIILLLKVTIPEKLALSFEFMVGIMLVVLGLNILIIMRKKKIHLHKHKHGSMEHIHFHPHKLVHGHRHEHRSFFIGLLHGLAGSAALTLLVLTTINSVLAGIFYILLFGMGSIAGMMTISAMLAFPFALIPDKLEKVQTLLRMLAGSISTIIGFSIIYNISFMRGLFL